jgi:hypothetical protein
MGLSLCRWINLAHQFDSGREPAFIMDRCFVEDLVRHGFAHADMGDLRHDVVQALDVLDIDGRIDVDAVGQQLLDIDF